MKKSWVVVIWTVLFIFLCIFTHSKIHELSYHYIEEFSKVEILIKDEEWDSASSKVNSLKTELDKKKDIWYKLINHEYFNQVFMSIEIINQGIYLENKLICLEELEKIKMTFSNLDEDESYDFNRIL